MRTRIDTLPCCLFAGRTRVLQRGAGFLCGEPCEGRLLRCNRTRVRAQGRLSATSSLFLLPRALLSQTGASLPLSSPNRCIGHIHGRYHLSSLKNLERENSVSASALAASRPLHREPRERPPQPFTYLTCSLQPRSRRCLPRHRFFRGPFPKAGARSQVSSPRPPSSVAWVYQGHLGAFACLHALATTPSAWNDSTTGSRFLARAFTLLTTCATLPHFGPACADSRVRRETTLAHPKCFPG